MELDPPVAILGAHPVEDQAELAALRRETAVVASVGGAFRLASGVDGGRLAR